MLLRVIAVGTRMPDWVDTAVDTYSRRMPPELRIDWKPVKAEPRESGGGAARCMAREAQRIRDALPAGAPFAEALPAGTPAAAAPAGGPSSRIRVIPTRVAVSFDGSTVLAGDSAGRLHSWKAP